MMEESNNTLHFFFNAANFESASRAPLTIKLRVCAKQGICFHSVSLAVR